MVDRLPLPERDEDALEVFQRLVEQVDQLGGRDARGLVEAVLQRVDLRGELDEADAPRRPLEGVVAAVQLVERPGLVVPPVEPEHQRLDPLEEVGGVGEEDLADLGIELDEGGGLSRPTCGAVPFSELHPLPRERVPEGG